MTDRLAEIKANHDRDIRTGEAIGIGLPRQCKEIAWLIAEVERLRTIHTDTLKTDLDFLQRTQDDAERWRYVREHGCFCLVAPREDGPEHYRGDEADAAVDAARKR